MRDVSAEVISFKPRRRVPQYSQSFKWLEESWADKNMPSMRLAVVMLGKNDAEIEAAIADGSLACLFKHWREVKRDLDEMRDALDVALSRSLDAVERMGRDPDGAA
jgi:hypothetical protein